MYADFCGVNTPTVDDFKLPVVSQPVPRLLKISQLALVSRHELAPAYKQLVELKPNLLGVGDRLYLSFHDLKEAWKLGTNEKYDEKQRGRKQLYVQWCLERKPFLCKGQSDT